MVENPRLVLGLKVRNLRHRRGETLQTLAERSGLSVSYLSEIEKGKKYPKPERLVLLAGALDVPFDELVSLQVTDDLAQLKAAFNSPLLRGFPFELFGLEPEDLLALVSGDPERGSALLRAVAEVGRSYDVHVEHFLLSALRAYQQLHANYFEDLEDEAMAFRRRCGWSAAKRVAPPELVSVLRHEWGYTIDEERLAEEPELAGFRSVRLPEQDSTLFVNPRLMPSQKAFALAREVGFRCLGLEERAPSSPWLAVESFDQVFNNFKASYFAGALLMDRERLRGDLGKLFGAESWDTTVVERLMDSYGVTPETFLHRLTQIVPRFFGLDEFFFLRFSTAAPTGLFRLTKWLNTSEVAVPRGFGLSEHYCRRWPALRLLNAATELLDPEDRVITAQRVWFVDDETEFLEFSMARPLALGDGALSAVSVGFLADTNLRRKVRFWSDPALSRIEVGLTCERCKLIECTDRVEPASILERLQEQSRKEGALQRLGSV